MHTNESCFGFFPFFSKTGVDLAQAHLELEAVGWQFRRNHFKHGAHLTRFMASLIKSGVTYLFAIYTPR